MSYLDMMNPQMDMRNHNPYGNNYWNPANSLPQYNIIQVNGKNGADAFRMGPNSKILLLDESAPIVWFVQTDGAGYKTVTPYTITPYQPAPQVDINDLATRLTNLEERFNAKSNSGTGKNAKRANANGAAAATNEQPATT